MGPPSITRRLARSTWQLACSGGAQQGGAIGPTPVAERLARRPSMGRLAPRERSTPGPKARRQPRAHHGDGPQEAGRQARAAPHGSEGPQPSQGHGPSPTGTRQAAAAARGSRRSKRRRHASRTPQAQHGPRNQRHTPHRRQRHAQQAAHSAPHAAPQAGHTQATHHRNDTRGHTHKGTPQANSTPPPRHPQHTSTRNGSGDGATRQRQTDHDRGARTTHHRGSRPTE